MTCRCNAEFCAKCGLKWKTCDCPWFNYTGPFDGDRLNDIRVPEPVQILYRRVFGNAPRDGAADLAVAEPAANPRMGAAGARSGPPVEVTYQQEMDNRRRQENLDADLARRMQFASLSDQEDEPPTHRRGATETWGFGNAANHFLNEDFVQNAANVVMDALGDAAMGRRGERSSGRQRRARATGQNEGDTGLVTNFLGDGSVVGTIPGARSTGTSG